MRSIILASRSPRRLELLKTLNLQFKVHPSEFTEIDVKKLPGEVVMENACGKARDIARHYQDAIIIGVDTIGVKDHHILEKPKDFDDAFRILKIIQGTTHQVFSGICLIDTAHGQELTAVERTDVTFAPMTDSQIIAYIKTGEGMDKAAAFAIQGIGALFIEKINGCYFNVMGLPLFRLGLMLTKLGIKLF